MTTLYDVDDLEKANGHLEGEIKDAKRIIKEYLSQHQAGGECRCSACVNARAWLARNK